MAKIEEKLADLTRQMLAEEENLEIRLHQVMNGTLSATEDEKKLWREALATMQSTRQWLYLLANVADRRSEERGYVVKFKDDLNFAKCAGEGLYGTSNNDVYPPCLTFEQAKEVCWIFADERLEVKSLKTYYADMINKEIERLEMAGFNVDLD